jgi:hypothetical protein
MLCASAENIMFLVFTGQILDFKASLESNIQQSCWLDLFSCCRTSRASRTWYVRIWARIRSLDKSVLNHYEEIEVSSQEFGSKVIKNFYKQVGHMDSSYFEEMECENGEPKLGEAMHLECADEELLKED